jgi:hypothetical protein
MPERSATELLVKVWACTDYYSELYNDLRVEAGVDGDTENTTVVFALDDLITESTNGGRRYLYEKYGDTFTLYLDRRGKNGIPRDIDPHYTAIQDTFSVVDAEVVV